MRALIAGKSGFIGSALASALESDGHETRSLGRPGSTGADGVVDVDKRRVELFGGGSDLSGFDVVFQLLGEPLAPRRWGPRRREAMRASRITTTELLARAIAASNEPPPVFIVGCAVGYYGARGDEVIDERSVAGEGFLADLCRAWEAAALPARAAGARVVYGRSGVVFGPGGGALSVQAPIFRLGLGARLGDGRQWTSWIALEDEVRAMRHLAETSTLSGPVNLVSPNPATNERVTRELADAVGRRARLVAPRPLLEAALGRRCADEFILASQRAVPTRLVDDGFEFHVAELREAIELALSGPRSA